MANVITYNYSREYPSSRRKWTGIKLSVSYNAAAANSYNCTYSATLEFYDETDVSDPHTYKIQMFSGPDELNVSSRGGQQAMTFYRGTSTDATWVKSYTATGGIPGTGSYFYRFDVYDEGSYPVCSIGGWANLYYTSGGGGGTTTPSTSPTQILVNGVTAAYSKPSTGISITWSGGTKGTNFSSWHVVCDGSSGSHWEYWVTSSGLTADPADYPPTFVSEFQITDYFAAATVGNTYTYKVEALDGSTGRGFKTSASVTIIANTYLIKYNANGGEGAPSAQQKTQGVTLVLDDSEPTRSGYSFRGWATSSTATTATYQPGGNYTANAAATLYAVWWKCCYVYRNSKWNEAIPYVYVNSAWKRAMPYVYNGGWK